MSESSPFELPSPSEKLPFKFILDSLKAQLLEEPASNGGPTEGPPAAPEEAEAIETLGTEITSAAPEPHEGVQPVAELTLPEGKKYFRIGEVSDLIGVEPYVLRYWEGEFTNLRPVKSGSGHRVYARKEVEMLNLIRHLLHNEKFSIKGAKKRLLEMKKESKSPAVGIEKQRHAEHLKGLAHELKMLIQLAKGNPGN